MNLEDIMLSEVSQAQRDKHSTISLYVEPKIVDLRELEKRMMGTRGRGGECGLIGLGKAGMHFQLDRRNKL